VCTEISRKWAAQRVQWGAPVGKHEAVAQMLAGMAANTFAIESMAELSSLLADEARNDIRLEAAIAKLWTTEMGWKIVDDTLQIRSGRGDETSDSLRDRGEFPIPVERILRDFRINRIFEGSSEIMRLFIAREAVDTHLQVAGALIDPRSSMGEKLAAAAKAGVFYATWLPKQFVGTGRFRYGEFGRLAKHLRYVDRTARRLARSMFYAMGRYQAKMERKQALLFRFVDIGAELYAMAATCVRAQSMRDGPDGKKAAHMADVFCRTARLRIEALFDRVTSNEDDAIYRLSQEVLRGEHAWLEAGAAQMIPDGTNLVPTANAAEVATV
jgi:alkylation response protein AidB-like acyl-CoA dehydrogenase